MNKASATKRSNHRSRCREHGHQAADIKRPPATSRCLSRFAVRMHGRRRRSRNIEMMAFTENAGPHRHEVMTSGEASRPGEDILAVLELECHRHHRMRRRRWPARAVRHQCGIYEMSPQCLMTKSMPCMPMKPVPPSGAEDAARDDSHLAKYVNMLYLTCSGDVK